MANENGPQVPLFSQRSLIEIKKTFPENGFTVATYNTLADSLFPISPRYLYLPEQFKQRDLGTHRHKLQMKELAWLDADILCLQEVDASYYSDILAPALAVDGYQGFFIARSDGNEQGQASFYKTAVFDLVEQKIVCNNDEIQQACQEIGQEDVPEHLRIPTYVLMMALRHKNSGKLIAIGNLHVMFDWYGKTVRQLLECCLATKILKDFVDALVKLNNGCVIPYILCGDFNIEPHFPAYKVLSTKKLTEKDYKELEENDYVRFCRDTTSWPDPADFNGKISGDELKVLSKFKNFFKNSLPTAESTYKTILGKEPEYTSLELIEEYWTLDYLWYSSDTLQPTAVLDMVPMDKFKHLIGFPNEHFSSDHLSLKAYYHFIKFKKPFSAL